MSAKPDPKNDIELLRRYLENNRMVIADSISGSRVRLAAALCELGAKRTQIDLVGTVEEARESIVAKKPKVVLCEYQIGPKFGLDLLQDLRGANPTSDDSLFVLVTGNTSQSAVARAAEEDCDGFILKPYTLDTLRRSMLGALLLKIRPSEYLKKVQEGKDCLLEGDADGAIAVLKSAILLDPKPSLALFYFGQAERLKEAIEAATKEYKTGLSFNKIHYKCLVGLYEVMIKDGKHAEAYEVVKRMAQYFPANPKRLASVLKLAIVTQNYDDVESYYRIFTLLDERTEELVNYVCSALVVTGKHYLRNRTHSRAIELFDKAAVSCAGKTKFLRFIIETLVEFRLANDAEKFLSRFSADAHKSEDYLTADYILLGQTPNYAQTVQRGRDLIRDGVKNPLIYLILIEGSARAGFHDSAADLAETAAQLWPARASSFRGVLDRARTSEAPRSHASAS